jgi:hypothetical protein
LGDRKRKARNFFEKFFIFFLPIDYPVKIPGPLAVGAAGREANHKSAGGKFGQK